MIYTTTTCKHCGFRTRSHESGVPDVQIGPPILRCPRCGHLILDSIATEYEFMTEKEKSKFTTDDALAKSWLGNILFIIIGIVVLFGGIASGGGYIVAGLIFGLASIALGVYQMIHNIKLSNENVIEQAIYQSLKRTQNPKYVQFLETAYITNCMGRKYIPFPKKEEFMKKYSYFETRATYQKEMEAFNQLMLSINLENLAEENQISTFMHH